MCRSQAVPCYRIASPLEDCIVSGISTLLVTGAKGSKVGSVIGSISRGSAPRTLVDPELSGDVSHNEVLFVGEQNQMTKSKTLLVFVICVLCS